MSEEPPLVFPAHGDSHESASGLIAHVGRHDGSMKFHWHVGVSHNIGFPKICVLLVPLDIIPTNRGPPFREAPI